MHNLQVAVTKKANRKIDIFGSNLGKTFFLNCFNQITNSNGGTCGITN